MSQESVPGVVHGRFRRCAIATIVTIYALILVGGIVRATGSGMGCPDWPTCFGQWIPPTSEAQLPADYQSIYADRGYAETSFNVQKTWTEYLNRLLGVFTGFTILLTLMCSLSYRRLRPQVFWLSLSAFILVGMQGWLGSRVVASNLSPGMISLHMLLAQVIVGMVIAAVISAGRERYEGSHITALPRLVWPLLIVAMIAGLIQLVLGTQVREAIDHVARASNHENRHLWIDNLPLVFGVHKYYAVPLAALNGWLAFTIATHSSSSSLRSLSVLLMGALLGTIVIGMSLDRLHVPMFAQPLHLLLASMIFGVQLALLLIMRHCRRSARKSEMLPPAHGVTARQ